MFNEVKVKEFANGSIEVSMGNTWKTVYSINGCKVDVRIDTEKENDKKSEQYLKELDVVKNAGKFVSKWIEIYLSEKQRGSKRVIVKKDGDFDNCKTIYSPSWDAKSKAYKVLKALDYNICTDNGNLIINLQRFCMKKETIELKKLNDQYVTKNTPNDALICGIYTGIGLGVALFIVVGLINYFG